MIFAGEDVLLRLFVEVDKAVDDALYSVVADLVLFLLEGDLFGEGWELELHKAITRLVLVMNYETRCLAK